MIAALYSLRPGGTKNFKIKECNFGWMAIVDLFSREVECSCSNQLRRVKDLWENFIHRDSWTRLNVKPAKIMQVTRLLWSCIVAIIQGLPKCLCTRIYVFVDFRMVGSSRRVSSDAATQFFSNFPSWRPKKRNHH